ncbi:MAG: GntR family transcriptional regulator [Proteobacteria bacterium]|nr:GntR family transcriptional regulator [Pseudomonadota bacterium]
MADPAEPREPHATEPGGGSRSESVVVELRDMIMRGEFAAGFHLQEVPLAERMGVSRTPIREALNLLAKEGLLEPGPKRGYKIRTFTIGEIVEAYEVRATLEGTACRLLAETGLPEDVAARLQDSLEFGDRLIGRGMFTSAEHDPWLEMNNTIHSLLVSATRNAMLAQCVEQTQRVPLASARHVHWYRFDKENYELAQSAHRDHHGIVDAILRRQAGRAEARMREHIHFSQELVREHFKNQAVGFDTVVPIGAGRAKP